MIMLNKRKHNNLTDKFAFNEADIISDTAFLLECLYIVAYFPPQYARTSSVILSRELLVNVGAR